MRILNLDEILHLYNEEHRIIFRINLFIIKLQFKISQLQNYTEFYNTKKYSIPVAIYFPVSNFYKTVDIDCRK